MRTDSLTWKTILKILPVNDKRVTKIKAVLFDHMMQIAGLARDKSGNKWYYTKNSWGSNSPTGSGVICLSAKIILK